ncbi:MAG: hypothetical protein II381_09300 [Victivallales bacterium]|nr:hypothetical protein [Victivallales bacterium]
MRIDLAEGGTRYRGFYRVAILTDSDTKESAQTAFLREGEKTIGVWLPLALADLMRMLHAVQRRAGGDTGKIQLPERSEILESWMLPAMAAAAKEDEEEAAAFEMLQSVRNLKRNEQVNTPV